MNKTPLPSTQNTSEGQKYRKRPVVITAQQFLAGKPIPKGVCFGWRCGGAPAFAHVHTIHENQRVDVVFGDWIVPEPDGEHYYPVKDDIFWRTYERLDPSVVNANAALEHTGASSENPAPPSSTALEEIQRILYKLSKLKLVEFYGTEQYRFGAVEMMQVHNALTALTKASSLKPKTLEETVQREGRKPRIVRPRLKTTYRLFYPMKPTLETFLFEIERRAEAATKIHEAAKQMDWGQVVLNGGPPCFHVHEDGRFCGRAERWAGHGVPSDMDHEFVPLHEIAASRTDTPALVKVVREAQIGFETIAGMAEHSEPRSSRYAKGKLADLAALLSGEHGAQPDSGEKDA